MAALNLMKVFTLFQALIDHVLQTRQLFFLTIELVKTAIVQSDLA